MIPGKCRFCKGIIWPWQQLKLMRFPKRWLLIWHRDPGLHSHCSLALDEIVERDMEVRGV